MNEAIVSGIVAVIVCLINSWVQMSRYRNERKQTISLIEYRLEELTKQVRQHNNLVERIYKLEQDTALQESELHRINKRLEVIENHS